MQEYDNKNTKKELLEKCKELGITKHSSKNKTELINLINKTINDKYFKLNMIDLFAGKGAFSLAFEKKVNVIFANDMMTYSKKIYDENFDHKLTLQDINKIKNKDIPSHDILTGGFPCQTFSIARLQEGFKDQRSNVFWKILSIIDYHNPKCVILENVKNILSHDKQKKFNTIKNNLEKRGYNK